MAQIQSPETFADGQQVTAARLNNLVSGAILLPGAIIDQTSITANTLQATDSTIVNDAGVLKKATIGDILNSSLPITTPSVTGSTGADLVVTPAAGQKVSVVGNVQVNGTVSVSGDSNIIPAGSVMCFATNTAPSNWLKCNGDLVSRTTYAALFAAIGTTFGAGDGSTTFKLPDLRGEFIRGFDDARGVDAGRAFGSSQVDMFKSHNHGTAGGSNFVHFPASAGEAIQEQEQEGGPQSYSSRHPTTGNTGGAETRPRNIALLYCIKT